MAKILIVEDDIEVGESIQSWLEMEHFVVELATTGEDAVQLLEAFQYDLIVLDWQLPGMSGYAVLKHYRASGGQSPTIFLTGRNDVDSIEFGLDGGADDYLTKPFDMRELSARIRSSLRRPGGLLPEKISIRNVSLDSNTNKVLVDSKLVRLTNKEYAVLEFLMRNADHVFGSRALLDAVWPAESAMSEDTVRSCIKNLRRKITVDGQECILKTIAGTGYTIEKESPDISHSPA